MLKKMKRSIMKSLFKKELYDIHNGYQAQVNEYKKRIEVEAKLKLKDLEMQCKIPHRIFELYKNAEIIGIEKNKRNEELFVFKKRVGLNVYIKMCGESYWAINHMPRIYTRILGEGHSRGYCMFIDDVQNVDNNIGNSSIAMKYLIETAKEIGVPYIEGELSPFDRGHFDRLEHFYKKFGFKVSFNKERTAGTVKLELNNFKSNIYKEV
ncbi:hypothetical protein COK86_27350 [Bacillus cereus]|uniref:Uncharacterized protein n=1 Tax=Bacillus cereus TaxID=1396 RepID=A0A2B3TR96_BACCE|nr:hypothetical protein [Bacillus cereus]PFU37813.1 hypothetical protein COK86_27350 [Bacillus cereus]